MSKSEPETTFTESCGNVFADLGLPHADIMLAVARANPDLSYPEFKAAVQDAVDHLAGCVDELAIKIIELGTETV